LGFSILCFVIVAVAAAMVDGGSEEKALTLLLALVGETEKPFMVQIAREKQDLLAMDRRENRQRAVLRNN
jgi:hypothetical protein